MTRFLQSVATFDSSESPTSTAAVLDDIEFRALYSLIATHRERLDQVLEQSEVGRITRARLDLVLRNLARFHPTAPIPSIASIPSLPRPHPRTNLLDMSSIFFQINSSASFLLLFSRVSLDSDALESLAYAVYQVSSTSCPTCVNGYLTSHRPRALDQTLSSFPTYEILIDCTGVNSLRGYSTTIAKLVQLLCDSLPNRLARTLILHPSSHLRRELKSISRNLSIDSRKIIAVSIYELSNSFPTLDFLPTATRE